MNHQNQVPGENVCIHLTFDYKKATQSLNFFAIQCGGCINKMKVIKLIYFADRYHLRKYGRPITNDEYYAMQYGPVNSGVKDIAEMSEFMGKIEIDYALRYLFVVSRYEISSCTAFDPDVFSETDIEALEFVWRTFGRYGEFDLADLTHQYPEWKRFKDIFNRYSRFRMHYEDFLKDSDEAVEICWPLTEEEKRDRLDEIREASQLTSLWS